MRGEPVNGLDRLREVIAGTKSADEIEKIARETCGDDWHPFAFGYTIARVKTLIREVETFIERNKPLPHVCDTCGHERCPKLCGAES